MIRKAWTAYAAALSAAIVIGEVTNLAGGGRIDPRTLANWVLTAVLLVATWGYALHRPLGPPHYWRPAFWVLVFATIVTIVPVALAGLNALVVVGALLPFVVPAFVATYLYAYRSPELWPTEETSR